MTSDLNIKNAGSTWHYLGQVQKVNQRVVLAMEEGGKPEHWVVEVLAKLTFWWRQNTAAVVMSDDTKYLPCSCRSTVWLSLLHSNSNNNNNSINNEQFVKRLHRIKQTNKHN